MLLLDVAEVASVPRDVRTFGHFDGARYADLL